jgi:hypothetical protein
MDLAWSRYWSSHLLLKHGYEANPTPQLISGMIALFYPQMDNVPP